MISSISTEAALAVPGVVAVLTAADLPLAATGRGRTYEPLAREEVVYAGHPVALVVAESEAAAEDGAELVEVDLDPLEPVLDLGVGHQAGSPARSRQGRRRRCRLGPRRRPRVGRDQRRRRRGGAFRQRARHRAAGERRRRRRPGRQPRGGQRTPRARRGCTRATSSPRPRPRGSSPTASSSCPAPPRLRSRLATRWPSCSECPSGRSASAARPWAARSAARSWSSTRSWLARPSSCAGRSAWR